MKSKIEFTPENLIQNIHLVGPWSAYGLASEAIQHYFPKEYDEEGNCDISTEVKLMYDLGCDNWHDVIIKFHKEVGYKAPNGFNILAVNEN
jgi:hypothetical protein